TQRLSSAIWRTPWYCTSPSTMMLRSASPRVARIFLSFASLDSGVRAGRWRVVAGFFARIDRGAAVTPWSGPPISLAIGSPGAVRAIDCRKQGFAEIISRRQRRPLRAPETPQAMQHISADSGLSPSRRDSDALGFLQRAAQQDRGPRAGEVRRIDGKNGEI